MFHARTAAGGPPWPVGLGEVGLGRDSAVTPAGYPSWMSKSKVVHRCTDCGSAFPKWAGRCGSCGAWNTLVEEVEVRESRTASVAMAAARSEPAQPLGQVDVSNWQPRSTGIAEIDRVLSGGLVPGSVTLLGGEPGIGKSTILLQLLGAVSGAKRTALLISGEESVQQVRLRAERLDAISADLWIVADTSIGAVVEHIRAVKPEICVVDSIQTLADPELSSAPGTVSQVRDCTAALIQVAKELGVAIVLVGHVTKDGNIAGPRVLEHMVDTVLSFEGDRHHHLRLLRAVKHRFGATGELGLFEMRSDGLIAVDDPSAMLLLDRQGGVPGSMLVPVVEGHRPLIVEVQGLVAQSSLTNPRRVSQGFDFNRLAVLLAVIERRVGVAVSFADVFVSVVGGVRIAEPAADLAVALAILSSIADQPVDDGLVAIGEVGLSGEIRQVSHFEARLREAARLGATRAVVPASSPRIEIAGIALERVATMKEAADIVGGVDSIKRNRRAQAEAERSESSPRYTSPFKPSGQRPTELNLKRIARDPWPEPDHGPGTEPWDN